MQDHGSNDKKDQWLDWKYEQATTADGAHTIGLGTDVGGLAMCYRRDLFEQAGLPTDRDEVSALWPTWDDFIATGEQFQEGIGDDKVHFIDSATNTYNSILMQCGDYTYFDTDDNLVIETQPGRQGRLGPVRRHGRRRDLREAEVVLQRVERRLQERRVRDRGLPGLDDRLHRGAGRRGRTPASGTSPPCPAAAATGAARSSPCPRPSENQDLAIELAFFLTSADGQLSAFENGRQPAVEPDAVRGPGRQGQDERVLQRRARRADLRGRRQQPRARLPRRQEPAGARRGRERPAQRRERGRSPPTRDGTPLSRTPRPRQADQLGRRAGVTSTPRPAVRSTVRQPVRRPRRQP